MILLNKNILLNLISFFIFFFFLIYFFLIPLKKFYLDY